MAEIAATQHRPVGSVQDAKIYTYAALTGADTTKPLAVGDLSEITVQMYGDFTGGGAVKIQASNDPRVTSDPGNAVWFDATYDGSNGLSLAAAGMKNLHEHPYYIRAVPSGTLAGVNVAVSGKLQTK